MPPNRFESEVESFLEGSHGDRTHIKRADHHTVTPLCGTLLRAIRWAIRQLRFEAATIAGLARQLATTWNTVWSHIKPCLQAASDDPARFAGVRVLGVDEHVWHHQDRRRRGPVSSPAS